MMRVLRVHLRGAERSAEEAEGRGARLYGGGLETRAGNKTNT
jgi:hypothetical protein